MLLSVAVHVRHVVGGVFLVVDAAVMSACIEQDNVAGSDFLYLLGLA